MLVLHHFTVLIHILNGKLGLVRECLRPEEVLIAARAEHVIAASILLNLNEAIRATSHQLSVLLRPFFVLLSIDPLKAEATLLRNNSHGELLLTTIRIHAKAIVLDEISTAKWARSKLTIELKLRESLIKSKSVELIPSMLIDEGLDLLILNDLVARKVRALHTDEVVNCHHNSNFLSSNP